MYHIGFQRMTRQRKIILEKLRELDTHPTAEELHALVRRQLPRIGLGTVYRNLELLSCAGMIQKLATGGEVMHFDGETKEHYHARCVKCGCVRDVHMPQLSLSEKALRAAGDFDIIGHRLEFLGLCPKCKRGKRRARGKKKSVRTGRKKRKRKSKR
ncbi:MAG: transcriptional repressor [Planctomycetota bacterium]|nr:MAG: transcriptional repressor [Planctomycetota bacterium]